MLKLKRYPDRSPYIYIRGTVAGIGVFESTGTTDKGQAEAYRIKRERELWERGALGHVRPATFADAVSAYLDSGGSDRFLLRLVDHFKERPVSGIGQIEIDRAARSLYPDAKPSTHMRQVYGPCGAVLNHAARVGLPGAIPVRLRAPKIVKAMKRWGTDEHITAILLRCNPRVRAVVLTITYTGLRISEALAMTPADLRMRAGWANINRTKNGEPAFVPLPEQALEAIAAILPTRPDAPLFGYRSGQGVNKALRKAADEAGVSRLSSHPIGRHSFAARLLNAGYGIKLVKEAGRWKKLSVVDESYGHLEQQQAHDAMRAVAQKRIK